MSDPGENGPCSPQALCFPSMLEAQQRTLDMPHHRYMAASSEMRFESSMSNDGVATPTSEQPRFSMGIPPPEHSYNDCSMPEFHNECSMSELEEQATLVTSDKTLQSTAVNESIHSSTDSVSSSFGHSSCGGQRTSDENIYNLMERGTDNDYSSQEMLFGDHGDSLLQFADAEQQARGDCSMYGNHGNTEETEPSPGEQPADNPTGRVIQHLDGILREKLNQEIEEFRSTVHGLLNEQQHHVQYLLSLTPQSSSGLPQSPQSQLTEPSSILSPERESSLKDSGIDSTDETIGSCLLDDLELQKTRCLVELFTAASVITTTLQRQEFRT